MEQFFDKLNTILLCQVTKQVTFIKSLFWHLKISFDVVFKNDAIFIWKTVLLN
jgi:hypothetical protein